MHSNHDPLPPSRPEYRTTILKPGLFPSAPWQWVVSIAIVAALALAGADMLPRQAHAQTSCGPDTHSPGTDPEVLVGSTPTRMPQLCGRGGFEIQNLGPNPIWCVTSFNSAHARVGRARRVDADGGLFPVNARDTQPVWCISSVAQVEGAATIVSEVR